MHMRSESVTNTFVGMRRLLELGRHRLALDHVTSVFTRLDLSPTNFHDIVVKPTLIHFCKLFYGNVASCPIISVKSAHSASFAAWFRAGIGWRGTPP